MKNIKKCFVLFLTIFVLTGCYSKQYETIKIDKEKNVSFKISISMDNEMIDNILKISSGSQNIEITDEDRWEYLSSVVDKYENWNKETLEENDYKGYILTYKSVLHLDDLLMNEELNGRYIFLSNEDVAGNSLFKKENDTYKSVMSVSPPEEYKTYLEDNISNYLDMKFIIELPNKPISSNADEVSKDGKRLTWNISEQKNIDFSFRIEKGNIYTYIIVFTSIVIFICFIILTFKRNKSNNF